MKTIFTLLKTLSAVVASCLWYAAGAQLNYGGFHANFGVDADTRADYIKYGPNTGGIQSDDWYSINGTSKGVIDTTGAGFYRSLLQQGKNIAFTQRMSAPLYFKYNNTTWIDAVYSRDFIKADLFNLDTTAYVSSNKNAEDPALWNGGAAGVSNKNDIMDVYTHMRRNGTHVNDSLWLFTAVSMVGTTGSKYYDVELFKNSMGFNKANGAFTTGGPDEGHVQWIFDANGNLIQTGDLIIAVTYNPGGAPVIEVRIWVSRATHSAVKPALFNFSPLFDANTNLSVYGYASIVSKNGSTAFGSGAGNYSSTTTKDTTYSNPWGTTTKWWQQHYDALQFVEVGINLTRIGIDPALYGTLGDLKCASFFKSILYKSRSSASFSSSLNDFVGPLDFMRIPLMDYTIQFDTLTCNKSAGRMQVTNQSTSGYYSWRAIDGNITSTSSDLTTMMFNRAGTYEVKGAITNGCAAGRTDTITTLIDTLKPVAKAEAGIDDLNRGILYGGDPLASNYATPFGGSSGLSYSWTGPSGFTSLLQNPFITSWGTYNLTITELRNGCTSGASVMVNFITLSQNMNLEGTVQNRKALLQWTGHDVGAASYGIEKSTDGFRFEPIGSVPAPNRLATQLTFLDNETETGWVSYRIRQITRQGGIVYSNIIRLNHNPAKEKNYFAKDPQTGRWSLIIYTAIQTSGLIEMYNTGGALVRSQVVQLSAGKNIIAIPSASGGTAGLATVKLNREEVFSQKLVF